MQEKKDYRKTGTGIHNPPAAMLPHLGGERPQTTDPAREFFLNHTLGMLIIKNAFPAVASMLFMAFYQVVDGILVGRRLGPEALASINILYPILALFVGLNNISGRNKNY